MILYPDPILTTPATPVEHFDSTLADVAELISEELKTANGLAVAAQQVGATLSVFGYLHEQTRETLFIVNPRLVYPHPKDQWVFKEGCLSLPGRFWYIRRPRMVAYEGATLKGRKVKGEARGIEGRMFQHEVDHLRGKLIVSRLTLSERKKLQREMKVEVSV